jgi:hypothetical protein
MVLTVPLVKDFKSGMQAIKKVTQESFGSLLPIGNMFLGLFMATCPFNIPKTVLDESTALLTICTSNLYASKVAFTFDGKKLLSQFYYGSMGGALCGGITTLTIGDKVGLACFSDESKIEKPQEMIDIILRKNAEVLKSA